MKRKPLPSNLSRLGWLLTSLLLLGQLVHAQTSTVSGVIKDAGVEAVPGGITMGTVADREGSGVPHNAVLVGSGIRYSTQEVVAGSRAVVNIVLLEDVFTLKPSMNYNDCLEGWTPCHPKGFYDLTETKTLNQNLC